MQDHVNPERLKYRWVVLVASFLVRFLVFGSLFAVGVLYVAWLDEFQTKKGDTAWIGSLATGSCLLVGPLASAIISKIGSRRTIVLGGVLMASGMILSVFATNIYFLFFTYGILAGCGGGITNLAAVVRIGDYFRKQRAFAMGVGSSGVGLGAFAFAVFQQYLMNGYGWRGTLLIIGGICLNICVAGLMMIHPKHLMQRQVQTNSYNPDQEDRTISQEMNEVAQIEERSVVTEPKIGNGSDVIQTRTAVVPTTGPVNYEMELVDANMNQRNSKSTKQRRKSSVFQRLMIKMKFADQTKALWRDPVFLLLFTSDFLSWMVQFVPYVHLPQRARNLGISPSDSAILVSSMGFAGAVGKLSFGAICTFLKLDPYKVFTSAQILFGISTLLSPLCHTFVTLLIYAISFGFLSGAYALMMVIPADLIGIEKFSAAYGFLLAGEGVGVYLGPPIAGWISDISDSYDTSFYCAGAVLLTSGLILLLLPLAKRMRKRLKAESTQVWTN